MNGFQKAMLRRQVMTALKLMEAEKYTILRPKLDENGMPAGQEELVGVLFGVRWRKSSGMRSLLIAIPGITLDGSQSERLFGLMTFGEAPREGDRVQEIERGGRILDAQSGFGVISLILEDCT